MNVGVGGVEGGGGDLGWIGSRRDPSSPEKVPFSKCIWVNIPV